MSSLMPEGLSDQAFFGIGAIVVVSTKQRASSAEGVGYLCTRHLQLTTTTSFFHEERQV